MINFRYHLVSLAAIMLALAAGIALGSGPLDAAGAPLTPEDGSGTSRPPDAALTSFESSYAGRTAGFLLKDVLKAQSVVVMTTPGADVAQVKGVTTDLSRAGAQVTGQVELGAKLLDPSGRQFAEGVAQQSAAGVPGVDAAGDSYGRIGAALGRAFVADKAGSVDPTSSTIRSAFTEGGLITLTTTPKRLATLIVLVTGPRRSGGAEQSNVIAALAGALSGSGKGVLVAGPSSSSTDGGAVKAVRDGAFADKVATVDVTDSAAGRVLAAVAAARTAEGSPGAWGTPRSADGALPN